MDTQIYNTNQIKQAAQDIKNGQLVAFPTETVYGLGADATNVNAVKNVFKAKGRPSDNPLIIHVSGKEAVQEYAQPLSNKVKKLMDTFWPGPLTLILKLQPNALPSEDTGGLDTAAFRNPKKKAMIDLIKEAGVPLVGPSANTSGKPSPTKAEHVYHDLKGKIAGILDGGETDVGVESTVLDMSVDTPTVLRPGGIPTDEISKVIGPVNDEASFHKASAEEVPKAPGMKYKHYAPSAQVYVVDNINDWKDASSWASQQQEQVGVMATDDILNNNNWSDNVETFSIGTDVKSGSHLLFAGLRHFDNEKQIKNILVQGFSNSGLGEAYMNRLNKSAGQKHFTK